MTQLIGLYYSDVAKNSHMGNCSKDTIIESFGEHVSHLLRNDLNMPQSQLKYLLATVGYLLYCWDLGLMFSVLYIFYLWVLQGGLTVVLIT